MTTLSTLKKSLRPHALTLRRTAHLAQAEMAGSQVRDHFLASAVLTQARAERDDAGVMHGRPWADVE